MKRILPAVMAIIAILSQPLKAEDGVTTRESKWTQVAQAYGFMLGQRYTLDRIATEFPDLAPSVRAANFAFMSTGLGGGADALEPLLKNQLGEEWPATKAKMEQQFLDIATKMVLTRNVAEQGIEEIKQRAKGIMPESVRNTLLANNPAYVKSPGAELAAGWRQNFSTRELPKAEGGDITIGFPLSWSKRDSSRKEIVKVFRSGFGHGPIMCNIMSNKILDDSDGDLSVEEMKEFFTEELLKGMVPDEIKLIESRPMMISGATGGMNVFDVTQEMLDVTMKMRSTTFVIAHKQHLIQVNFLIMSQALDGMDLDEAQKAYFPTYRAIMSTLVRN